MKTVVLAAPRERLAVTAWALMANTGITSALGLAFWALASRQYSPGQVGEGAALISLMILLSTVSQLNLGMGISRLLPQFAGPRWRPIIAAYGVTAVVGATITVGFIGIVAHLSTGFSFLSGQHVLQLALVGAVILSNVFALEDAVLTATHWAVLVPVTNGVFGVLKIGLMVVFADQVVKHGLFLAWLAAMAMVAVAVNWLIFAKVLRASPGDSSPRSDTHLRGRGPVARYLTTDYAAALLSQGSTALLPILVVAILGRVENAYFYVVFLIAGAVGSLAQSVSISLVVEGAHHEADLASLTRRSALRYVTVVGPALVALGLGAPVVLLPFGGGYVTHGTLLLRLLITAAAAHAVVVLYMAVERVRARVSRVLAAEGVLTVLTIGGAVTGMHVDGLAGLGVATTVAEVVVAAVVAPKLWRVIRS